MRQKARKSARAEKKSASEATQRHIKKVIRFTRNVHKLCLCEKAKYLVPLQDF